MTKTIDFAEWRERKTAEPGIVINMPDGSTITVPPAELWPDAVLTAVNPVEQGRALLGHEEYDRFVAAGGSGAMLAALVVDELQATPGE